MGMGKVQDGDYGSYIKYLSYIATIKAYSENFKGRKPKETPIN